MLKLAPAIEIKEVKNYDEFAKKIIVSFMMFPNYDEHIYDLDKNAEPFLPTFYKEPGFRVMYNEEMKRLYVQNLKKWRKKKMSNRIYVRGDTHGSYDWLEKFCQDEQTDYSDILILLGDHALRFEGYNNRREVRRKEQVSKFPITIFGLQGNHDRPPRPDIQKTHCPLTVQPMLHDEKYSNLWYFCENEFPV